MGGRSPYWQALRFRFSGVYYQANISVKKFCIVIHERRSAAG